MKDIKTKSKEKDIKIFDSGKSLTKNMRRAYLRNKDNVKNLNDDTGQASPSEYAEDKVKYTAENAVSDAGHIAKDGTKKTYNGGKKLYKDVRRRRQEHKISDDAIKQTAKSTGKQTAKSLERTVKTQERTIKTAGQSARQTIKTSKQTAKATVKTAERTAKASKKAAEAAAKTARRTAQAARQAAIAAYKGAVVAVKATIAAIKAIIAGFEKLISAIAAGGGVAVLVIVIICLIGLIVGSGFGIFYSNEVTKGGTSVSEVVAQLNAEFQQKITDIQNSRTYDDFEIESSDGVTSINWEDVLAVFAVKITTGDNAENVACITPDKINTLRDIMWDMNAVSDSIRTETKSVNVARTDEYGNEVTEIQTLTRTILTVTITHKSYTDMVSEYSFTADQEEQLYLLKDDEYSTLWGELLGEYSGGSGEVLMSSSERVPKDIFSWPLQEAGTITSRYGYRTDPFTGKTAFHCGTDIAMPNGTPILAAADGNVIIANGTDSWGGTYGYYIKIRHDGGYDTLYAHCSSICVSYGQTVTKGQVIGYVGSTGNSTGNHLHFEIWKDGKRTDALEFYG